MTVVHSARGTARRAARSDVLKVLTRIGFAAFGAYCLFQARYRKVGA